MFQLLFFYWHVKKKKYYFTLFIYPLKLFAFVFVFTFIFNYLNRPKSLITVRNTQTLKLILHLFNSLEKKKNFHNIFFTFNQTLRFRKKKNFGFPIIHFFFNFFHNRNNDDNDKINIYVCCNEPPGFPTSPLSIYFHLNFHYL